MCWIPEERDGLLEDEAPLYIPIEVADKTTHRDWGDEGFERATTLGDMRIRNLMEGHKDGRKEGVHHHRE